MSNYRRNARRKALGISEADSKAMDQAFGYTPVQRKALTRHIFYDISVAEFAERNAPKKVTLPCLSPDEMRCEECGRYDGPDEVDWENWEKTGRILCINCVE
jgi:hypothetical protein